VLAGVERFTRATPRSKLVSAEDIAAPLLAYLGQCKGVRHITLAGSFRRRRDTVGDLDILVTAKKDSGVMSAFVAYDEVSEVISRGSTRSTVRLRCGLQVDLRVVPQVSYGAALVYFTGSKAHNIALRRLVIDKGWKLNEYGIFRGKRRIASKSEEEVYGKLGLPVITPELRENRGEIGAATRGRLPSWSH